MRSLGKCVTLFLAVLLIIFTTATPPLFGYDVKLIEKIEFSPEEEFPSILRSFCVTEGELIIIPDKEAGDIKIYETKEGRLKLIKTLGRKGFGVDELLKPTFCFYNRIEGKFGVLDYGKGEIIIYDRIGRTEFQRTYAAYCPGRGYDIQLSGNILLVSGYKVDQNGKPYDLYYFDLYDLPLDVQEYDATSIQPAFLMPSYYKYGLKSPQEYDTKVISDTDIKAIGTIAWFDVLGEDIYFAWEGDLKIIKANIKSGEKQTFLRKKSSRYVKPYVPDEMDKAPRDRNLQTILNERTKMSYIRDIFAIPKYVIVILEGPTIITPDGESNFWLQLYKLDGDQIAEESIPGQPGLLTYFDKDKEILYSLSSKGNSTPKYFLKYKISE